MKKIGHSVLTAFSALAILLWLAVAISKPTAEPGMVHATVVDAVTGKVLHKASVMIIEKKLAGVTNPSGQTLILNVPVGSYSIRAAYKGYEPDTIRNISIQSGATTEVSFRLHQIVSEHDIQSGNRTAEQLSTLPAQPLKDNYSGGYSIHGSNGSALSNTLSKRGFAGGQFSYSRGDDYNTAEYSQIVDNTYKEVRQDPLSTFSIDVDGGSYSNIRHFITNGQMPPRDAVRIEEMINYFKYDYAQPKGDDPFSINTIVSNCPWNSDHKLAMIGLQGKEIAKTDAPAANLTFLIDVSGSMDADNRLPLLIRAFKLLVNELRAEDRVAIVVYAGSAGIVLPPTDGAHKADIIAALEKLRAGGSTAGGEGIRLAYATAKEHYNKKSNNRVILATDGDFNIGISNTGDLVTYIEEQRASGIYLTTLGVGENNYKDSRLEQLADKGNGNYYYIDNILEAKKVFVTQLGGTLNTIAKDVKIQIEFNPAYVQGYRLIGYENRVLAKEDFNNDKKDAGELGSGHTVTALYEIIPVGAPSVELHSVDSLRYQQPIIPKPEFGGNEMMMVKFRYKRPADSTSLLIAKPIVANDATTNNTMRSNLEWASSVAEFGMLIRNSDYKGSSTIADVLQRSRASKGPDQEGYRAEFIRMVEAFQLSDKAVR